MAQWNAPESGILRKNTPAQNHDELLVFGYACKLFRDDEKALYIDQGKHLIPWMGDEKLKIDRYDCRGALSDLRKYEASREGFDAMRWLGLSDKERQLEELCDKERYYSLEINEEEEEMYKEEEQKRQKTNTFQYSYDVPTDPENGKQDVQTVPGAEEEEEYIPPPILDVPVDIDIPKTVKENARIEKTALFVCKQGPQMEILIKAKQADNPQFSFLNQGDRLYKFYRHVLAALKNGRYQGYEPKVEKKTDEKQDDSHDHDSSSHYLHPSLLSANLQPEPPTAIPIPQISYKPSANCTYSQLVNRIQGNQSEATLEVTKPTGVVQNLAQLTYEQQQYFQYYYAQQYYEYYKQLALFQQGQGGNPGQFVPPADFQSLDSNMQSYIQQLAYNQYAQQQQPNNNSYAQIVSNVNKDINPYTAGMPQLLQNLPEKEDGDISKNPIIYSTKQDENVIKDPVEKTEVVVKKPLLSLAAYGSGSESDSEDSSEEEEKEVKENKIVYMVPTGETQTVIDKMAVYVSKNGEQFEDIVKAKSDQRFDFLNDDHKYNEYYRAKIRELKNQIKEKQEEKVVQNKEAVLTKPVKREKKVIAPVSFSIKKAKEEQPKEIKSALPVEESDEEDAENITSATNTIASVSTTPSVASTIGNADSSKSPKEVVEITIKNPEKDNDIREVVRDGKKNGILDGDDPILEMIELTSGDISEDKRDAKRAEDKIKDKLAAAAREKLASVSRDRALQLERKKKAAAFLKLKSAETNTQSSDNVPEKLSSCKSSSRRGSVEIIEVSKEKESQIRKSKEKERSRSQDRERRKQERERAETKEKRKEAKEKVKVRERTGSREKEKRSRTPKRENIEEETENKKRKEDDKKEKRKKSHKR
ncbi:hypothetical protein NQ314_018479 [Rhamnusium bicolor]|uniref:SURP motif domain-containing protein n=1 Tax=Rhamnusium bicolor TaxID=1586634 RepID=A0AAV8WRC0_9CUCU|nr:hypothetical protein NQ314_018479 [Rhamnusium bicolor]